MKNFLIILAFGLFSNLCFAQDSVYVYDNQLIGIVPCDMSNGEILEIIIFQNGDNVESYLIHSGEELVLLKQGSILTVGTESHENIETFYGLKVSVGEAASYLGKSEKLNKRKKISHWEIFKKILEKDEKYLTYKNGKITKSRK